MSSKGDGAGADLRTNALSPHFVALKWCNMHSVLHMNVVVVVVFIQIYILLTHSLLFIVYS